ncbi:MULTISPECIES: GNAT family N-acetyltransferase [Alcaligenes]|jgi:ribosomal protein S18 acetylase RimI-like enzyme|nr:GNAT family N-acetyltransferase [Alcaligenes faecalis]MBQ0217866.1 GNAT family N-acetyltransferase [Alcaligenes faecalis]MBY6318907.1 GNAT family N-acetyltransferase [Alcaligenes faecalis]MBY6392829.1 GNAT family N-acetyltransferase [Alcaligenes faecalis]
MPTLRPAQLADIGTIGDMYAELFAHMHHLQPHYYLQARQDEGFIRSMIESDQAALFVAEKDDQALGFIIVQQQKTPPYNCITPHDFAYVIDLVVTESARGMGLGKLLMQTAQEWAHVRGLDYIELGVLSNNRGAIALYEQLGYEHNTSIMRKALK